MQGSLRSLSFGHSTIGQRVTETRGRTRGFDYLRASLSLAVIGFHSIVTSYGDAADQAAWDSAWRPLIKFILPSFFALSGFLVAGSLARCKTIDEFLTLRVVRIAPALFFEVLIAAFILGPLLTVYPLETYFTSRYFFSYLLNVTGDIHFLLPGVFLDNPHPRTVNSQLWTIPYELYCYITITVVALIGGVRRPWRLLAVILACLVLLPAGDFLLGETARAGRQMTGKMLVVSFLAGVAVSVFQDRIPLSRVLLLLSVVASYFLLQQGPLAYVAIVPIAYITVYLGLLDPPRTWFCRISDYSYGLYIYGFILQQTYAVLFAGNLTWWGNLLFTFCTAGICAALSWHLLEKPINDRRKLAVAFVGRHIRAARARMPAGGWLDGYAVKAAKVTANFNGRAP